MKLRTLIDPLNIIYHANFHFHTMICLWASGKSSRGFAFEMQLALTTLSSATALASDLINSLYVILWTNGDCWKRKSVCVVDFYIDV
jgi:hypothetical protein